MKNEANEAIDREYILRTAKTIVTEDRNSQYGEPEDNFNSIARLWGTYLDIEITEVDVCMMMVLLKVARVKTSTKPTPDSLIDIAGYAACAAEVGE